MRKLLIGSAIAAVLSMGAVSTVEAQAKDGTVIMRRPLVSKTRSFDWTVQPWSECSNSCGNGTKTRQVQCVLNGQYVYPDQHCTSEKPAETEACTSFEGCDYKWEVKSDWTDVKGCGEVVETREMQCRRSDGTVVGREMCPTPVPDETRKVRDLDTCSYSWDEKPWSAYSSECSVAAVRTRDVVCRRSNGETADDSFCSKAGDKPVTSETAERDGQCGYSWKEKDWGAFDSSCSTTAKRTRDVVCLRSDGVEVAETMCAGAGQKPALTDVQPQYGSCSYSWKTGEFGDPAPACGETTATRTVECQRSNGDIVPDASCSSAGAKPSVTDKRVDYQTCTYGYVEGSWSAWSNTCGQGTHTRDVSCMSSDGRKVADGQCSGDKPATSESDYRTEGCTTSWKPGDWARVPGCGASKDVRALSCLRSDGQIVGDAQCATAPRPDTERAATDYQTCTYGWTNGEWGAWSSSCGQAGRHRDVWCQSSDGRRVEDASCSGGKPEMDQSAYQTSGCGYEWVGDPFSAPVPACGATVQNRVTWCKRSDGQRVMDVYCQQAGLPQPSNTQPATDYSTCSYSWQAGDWSAPSTTCGTATQTRDVWCLRSDGTRVSPTLENQVCGGNRPASSQQTLQTSSCSYAAVNPSAWSGWDNACSASAKRTRTFQCQRGDGVIVADGECTSRGVSLVGTETGANYTNACPGYFVTGAWSDYSSHCSTSATRTRDVNCYRAGDNVFAGDQYCIDRGVAVPTRSETGQVLDQCGYNWQTGAFGAPAAACGATTQSRSVWCQRTDGAVVGDGSCNAGTRPSATQGATDYSACSYSWAEGAWRTTSSTCGSTTQTHDVWCRRADGATVADGYCGGGRPANDRSYTDYSACSYVWTPGAYSTPSACGATTATRPVPCIRQDGAQVSDAYCGGGQPATTTSTTDYSACGYNWKTGAFGAPAPACGATTQSRDVWCERTDGARVADGACGGGRPSNTQGASDYQTCGYSAYQIVGYSDWSSHCGSATRTQYYNCLRADGTIVADAECTNRGVALTNTSGAQGVYDQCGYSAYQIVNYGPWSSTCSDAPTRTQYYNCRRSDGTVVADAECTNRGVGLTNTATGGAIYDSCTYTTNWTGYGACPAGANQKQYRSVASCTRNQTGASVDLSYCGGQRSEGIACYYNPGGSAAGTVLGTYAFSTCSQQYDYPSQGTSPSVSSSAGSSCRTGVATYAQQCTNGGNFATNGSCSPKPWVSNPRGPTGYPCDIVCR